MSPGDEPARPSTEPRALTLRERRAQGQPFEGRFFERSPLFWPVAPYGARFAERVEWPDVSEYARVFDGRTEGAPVRFVAAPPAPVRRRGRETRARAEVDPRSLYDGRITLDRSVPTRPRSWHDFLNALVWGAFPRSKARVHARQHAAIARSLSPGATRIPPARSRAHDALALVDEGGVVVMVDDCGRRACAVFGHALFEGLVLQVRATIARAVEVRVPSLPGDVPGRLAAMDGALDARLADESLVPEDLPRVALRDCV